MKILTLSFLTESKASHASLSSIRQVTITLLVMLLTTASAIAQNYMLILDPNCDELMGTTIPVSSFSPTYKLSEKVEPTREGHDFIGWSETPMGQIAYFTGDVVTLSGNLTLYAVWDDNPYIITLNTNYDGGVVKSILVPRNYPTYTLTSNDEPNRTGYTFLGWSTSSTGDVQYRTNDPITLTGNLTLYAVWCKLTYTITNEEKKQVELSGYEGDLSPSILNISTNVTIDGISYSVTSIGFSAFENCDNLQSVTIPNSVTNIGLSAFRNCSSLQSVTIPNSVTSIGNYAFRNCSNLQSVTIPNSVTSIGMYAFSGCSNLQSVTIPNSVTSIGSSAFQNSGLTSVTIPNSVTSIANSAFNGCVRLQAVTIPNSVTSIEDGAFDGCYDLTSITIPNSVTSIGGSAFWGCYRLQSVTIYGNPKIGTDAFLGTPATVTMNLTASEIDGDYWTTFYNDGYNFQADENTTVYKGTVNESSLVLTEVSDKIVNRGTAVILKSTSNPVMTLTGPGSSDTNGNDLRGRSDRTLRTDVIANTSDANAIYTMGNTSAGFGFHRYTGEYVPAQKAFLPLYIENEATAKAQSLTIVFANETTGINSVSSDSNVQNDWFTLDGTRLSGKPTQPGIYINGKKKIAIK